MRDRNIDIVKRILNGAQIKETAEAFGISSVRARNILHRHCEKVNPDLYSAGICHGATNNYVTPPLHYLVEHRKDFISKEQHIIHCPDCGSSWYDDGWTKNCPQCALREAQAALADEKAFHQSYVVMHEVAKQDWWEEQERLEAALERLRERVRRLAYSWEAQAGMPDVATSARQTLWRRCAKELRTLAEEDAGGEDAA